MDDIDITKQLEHILGKEMGPDIYEIEKGMIRRFIEAIGEDEKKWQEKAPPTFAVALVPRKMVHEIFNAGIPLRRTLNGGNELENLAPIKAGDIIEVNARITDMKLVKGKKSPILFLFTEIRYTNQTGQLVVKAKNTYIKY